MNAEIRIVVTQRRRYFAAGDFLTRFPEGSTFTLLIESPFEKPGWHARSFSPIGLLFPGTTIRFEDRHYEIHSLETTSNYVCYYLKPWEDRFPIRVQFDYTRQECMKLENERKLRNRHAKARGGILFLAPLAGLLPEADQYRLQNEFGVQATQLTFYSAVACLVPGGAALIFLLAQAAGGAVGANSRYTFLYLAGGYLFFESLVRIYTCFKLEEPIGSLFAWMPIELMRTIDRRWNARKDGSAGAVKTNLLPLDIVKDVHESDYDLEVLSVLPKPHWSVYTGIHFRDQWYGLVGSETLPKADSGKKYRFFLREAPPGFCFRNTSEYCEDEVRTLQAERIKSDRLTWVLTFALIWGLLPEKDQERLAELYDYDALKFTLLTLVALALIGVFNLAASFFKIASNHSNRADFLLLLPAVYLLAESYQRGKQWRTGRPAGSLLGWVVRPFAKRLLE